MGSVHFGKFLSSGSVPFSSVNQTISVRSVRFVLMKNMVQVRCVRFGFGSITISSYSCRREANQSSARSTSVASKLRFG